MVKKKAQMIQKSETINSRKIAYVFQAINHHQSVSVGNHFKRINCKSHRYLRELIVNFCCHDSMMVHWQMFADAIQLLLSNLKLKGFPRICFVFLSDLLLVIL